MLKSKLKWFLGLGISVLNGLIISSFYLTSCANNHNTLTQSESLKFNYFINKTTFYNNETITVKATVFNLKNNDYSPVWYLTNLTDNKETKLVTNHQISIHNEKDSSTIILQPYYFQQAGIYQLQYKLLDNNHQNILENLKQEFQIQIKDNHISPNPQPDDHENTTLNPSFIYNSSLTLNKQYYFNRIQTTFKQLQDKSIQSKLNYDQLGNLFATLISDLTVLVKNNLISANTFIDLRALNWSLDFANQIMVVAESKYFNKMLNFSITENLTLNFNQDKFIGLVISDIPRVYSSRAYQKLLIEFIFNCLNEIDNQMNDFEKIVAVSKYIVNYVIYPNVPNGISTTNNFFDTLDHRIGACRNYVSLLAIMLNILEIPNFSSCGNLYTNNATTNLGLHMWNHVLIDNQWYVIDLTSLDVNSKIPTAIFQGGRRLKFDPNFFLIGKNDNRCLQYDNLVLASQIQNDNLLDIQSVFDNLDKNQNQNATFIYQDLWNQTGYSTILKDLTKNEKNLFELHYWNNYWYLLSYQSNQYLFYQLDLKNNQVVKKWTFIKNQNDFLANSSIGYCNFYFVYNNQTHQYGYFDLNECQNSQTNPIFHILNCQLQNPNPLAAIFLRIGNTIYEQYQDQLFVLIKDISKLNGFQLKPSYHISNQGWNSIGQLWQSISNLGTGQNQINITNYPIIDSQTSLDTFKQEIHWTQPELKIRQDLPQSIIINPNYFFQTIKNQIPEYHFKLNFLVSYQPDVYLTEYANIDYLWYHDNQLISYNHEFSQTILIKNKSDLNKLVGTWKCVAIDRTSHQSITSQTLTIKLDDNYQNQTFYPDYLGIKTLSNSPENPDLSIQTNFGVTVFNDLKAQYEVLFNNQVIDSNVLHNDQPINYFKSLNSMQDNKFGIYQLKITFSNPHNSNDQLVWWSPTYYMYKIKSN